MRRQEALESICTSPQRSGQKNITNSSIKSQLPTISRLPKNNKKNNPNKLLK